MSLIYRSIVILNQLNYFFIKKNYSIFFLNQIYQIMVVNILKNWNLRYSSNYFIKFVCFILIYYVINLYIV